MKRRKLLRSDPITYWAWQRRSMARAVARAKEYRQRLAEERQPVCEVRAHPLCSGKGEHAHHRLPRSRGGSDDPTNLVWTCHLCHWHVHDNPGWAREEGWIE